MIRIGYSISVVYAIVTQDIYLCYALLIIGVYLVLTMPKYKLTRYQRLRLNGGRHTDLEWKLLKFYYGNRCHYCGKRGAKLTKDHVIPVSKGGSDHIKNIVPACQQCNSKKSNKIVSL